MILEHAAVPNRALRIIVQLIFCCVLRFTVLGDPLARDTPFESIKAFVTAIETLNPVESQANLKGFFTIIEEPGVISPATADSVDSCKVVWENNEQAIVLAIARPPTRYTHWKIGVLFYLTRDDEKWRIVDVHRFDAQNRAGEVVCELTSGERADAMVTVTVTRGRRNWTYSESASYSPDGKKLVRRDPEE